MSRSLVLVLLLASLPACRTPTPRVPPPYEPPLEELCLTVAQGLRPVPVEALRAHSLLHKMAKSSMTGQRFSAEEMARAAADRRPDPRFSWERLRANARFLPGFLARVQRPHQLIAEGLERAGELLSVKVDPSSVPLHFVCGGPWDAFLWVPGKYSDTIRVELFFDLGWVADREPEPAFREFRARLEHELWHYAYVVQRIRWTRSYWGSSDPAAVFLQRLIEEGVGHYYSLRHHLYPAPSWPDFPERRRRVFDLLAERYPRYLASKDAEERRRLLSSSHENVPFWEKWSAVPGALMTYALERRVGKARLRALLAEEPFSLVLAYHELQQTDPAWPPLPPSLVDDARRLLEAHRQP